MQIFSIDASYPGPFCSFPDDDEGSAKASLAAMAAEQILEAAIISSGFKCFHQYIWPDGSLYKWAVLRGKGSSTAKELERELNAKLQPLRIYVFVSVEDPKDNPYKVGYETLEEYIAESRRGI